MITIQTMMKCQRWPVPEILMNRPKGNFVLKIDSLIAEAYREESIIDWANKRPVVDAPYNSMQTDEELHIYESADSDEADKEVELIVEKQSN